MNSRKFLESLKLAAEGVSYCIRTQRNMKIHLVVALFAALLCLFLRISGAELVMIINAIALVFICEIINTAVEKAVDTATLEYNPTAKISKDVAAGAVLVAALNSIITGILVFGRHLWPFVLEVLNIL